MPVLYRKYRPQIFKDVVGQKSIIRTLMNQIASGQVAHAYLFVGSRGVGKTSAARILAKAVNCKNIQPYLPQKGEKNIAQASPDALGDACGECDVCKAIQNGNYIDLIEIDAASNTGVDNVRELIEHVRFAPAAGSYKVFIIDEVHMLSKGAFNALLKTLEEPPKHTIFILATTEAAKVPATIISRTQRFDFKRLSLLEIEDHLLRVITEEKMELSKDGIRLIAEHSEGGLRDALSLLDKVFTLGKKPDFEEVLRFIGVTDIGYLENFLDLIAQGAGAKIPQFINSLIERGTDFIIFNRDFLEYLRKILVLKISREEEQFGLPNERLIKAKQFLLEFSENDLIYLIRIFLRSLKEQQTAPSSDLPVLLAGVEAVLKKHIESKSVPDQAPKSSPGEKAAAVQPKIEIANNSVKVIEKTQSDVIEAASISVEASVSKEEVLSQWQKVIDNLKEINGPLAHLLKSSPMDRLQGNRIIVLVKYKFHKENLEHAKNRETIGKILFEVYGQNLALSAEIKAGENKENLPKQGLADALKVFGGELLE